MENCVTVTHFVNPHRFWFKRSHSRITSKVENLFQSEINKYCAQNYVVEDGESGNNYNPAAGEIVAVYDPASGKWTRNRVEESTRIGGEDIPHRYRLWSLDEGIPKEAAAKFIRPLPDKFAIKTTASVKQGAIRNILPAQQFYDASEERICKTASTDWDKCINATVQSLVQSAAKTFFENITFHSIGGEEIQFGDLWFVTKQQKNINAADIIMSMAPALIVDENQVIAHITSNTPPATQRIPNVSVEKDIKGPRTAVSQEPSLFPDTDEPVTKSTPENLAGAATTNAIRSRVILAKLKRISNNQQRSPTPIAKQQTSEQPAIASNEAPTAIDTNDVLLDPVAYLNLAKKPCREPTVDLKALNSSVTLERLTISARNPEPCLLQPLLQPVEAQCPEPYQERRRLPIFLKKKLARASRAKSETSETGSLSSVSATNELPAFELDTTRSDTDAETPSTPGKSFGSELDDVNVGQLSLPSGLTLSTGETHPLAVTVQPAGDISRFERFLKEEQCVLSQLRHHRILVHGQTVPKPIDSIAKANFCPGVHHMLEHLGIRMVYRLQAYAWPHIMRGNSLVCVNSAGTGKTIAFLPAICSLVKMRIDESLVSSDAGPVGIIVCYSTTEVLRVAHLCRRMLNPEANKKLTVVECYGVRLVNQVCNMLFAGCALLVTTMPAYRRLYESMPEAFVRKRIQIIVIDNIEQMLQHFSSDILMLCKNCDKPDMQVIVTAGFWHTTLASFLIRYKNMIVCIGAYLEAAVYAQVQFLLQLRRNDGSKQQALIQYIRSHDYRSQRTIVFASTSDDLDPIVETLRHYSINFLVCSDSTIINQHDGFCSWDDRLPGDMVVLVCLDELLGDLRISKAQHIVHYSLPSSWTCFTRRFATAFNYYVSPYVKRKGNEPAKSRASTLVLLDENNNYQLPKLIDFLELHQVKFAEELSKLAQNIRNVSEYVRTIDGRAVHALCPQLLALAACRNFRTCVYRHSLMTNDLSEDGVPSSGTVRLNILHVFSPVHFSGRLEAVRDKSTSKRWIPLCDSKKFLLHDIRLQAYFANADRHHMYGKEVVRNDLCALFLERNYWRCRIIHFEPEGDSPTVGEVQLKLIDTGRIVHTKSINLLCLPDQFHALPAQAIDVRIAGVAPHDFEEDWDRKSTLHVQRLLTEHIQRSEHYVQGKIVLTLRDMIWIDELALIEELDGLKTAVVSMKIKASVVSKQFGVYDTASFERIQQLVRQCESNRSARADDPLSNAHVHQTNVMPDEKHVPKSPTDNAVPMVGESNQSPSSTVSWEFKQNKHQQETVVEPCLDFIERANKRKKMESVFSSDVPNGIPLTTISPGEFSNGKDNSTSSTSSFELLSPIQDNEQYSFESLELDQQYHVTIGRYFGPDLFYLYRKETMAQLQPKIQAHTTNADELKPLMHPMPRAYCLVYYDNVYCRCQIMEVTESLVQVFLLDFGGKTACYPDTLFEIPVYLLRDDPFAALEATFGQLIVPMSGSTWTDDLGIAIYDDVLSECNDKGSGMIATVLATLSSRLVTSGPEQSIEGCHRYQVLLSDPNSSEPFSLIQEMVLRGLVMCLSSTNEPTANNDCNEAGEHEASGDLSDEDESGPFVQLDFTHEELRDILGNISKKQSGVVTAAIAAAVEPAADGSKGVKPAAVNRSGSIEKKLWLKKSTVTRNEQAGAAALPALKSDHRFPPTAWRQDNHCIMLYVSAPEVSEYQLTVRTQSVLLQYIHDDHHYILPLNLFGPIDAEHTTHEVRGLMIVIRLARLPGSTWCWPTLLNHTGKVRWLKKLVGARRSRRRANSDESESDLPSGSESADEMKSIWDNLLPTKLDYAIDFVSENSEDDLDDDLGLQQERTTEDEIFFRHK